MSRNGVPIPPGFPLRCIRIATYKHFLGIIVDLAAGRDEWVWIVPPSKRRIALQQAVYQ